jgi:3-hydroxy-9,10-secoandrosta-1,3,5(10)-triene-9,17-dione monooxygenase reductase component
MTALSVSCHEGGPVLPGAGEDNWPVDPDTFRDAVGRFATGVTIVTTSGPGGSPAGFTCQAFMSLSTQPPRVLIAPGRESVTWSKIAESRAFCVNILSDSHEPIARRFAVRDDRKFEGVEWAPSGATGSPVLRAAVAWVDCSLTDVFDLGDHFIAVGLAREAVTATQRTPLIYFRGEYMHPAC